MRKTTGFQPTDFAAPREYLTPDGRRLYDRNVAAVVAGEADTKTMATLYAFAYFNLDEWDGYRLYPASSSMPTVKNLTATPATAWLDPAKPPKKPYDRLAIQFTVRGDVVLTDGKAPYTARIDKKITFAFRPGADVDSDQPWLIDAWAWELDKKAPVKRPNLTPADAS